MKLLGFVFGILFCSLNVKAAAEFKGENIITLSETNFHREVMENPQVSVVTFYTNESENEDLVKEIQFLSEKTRGFLRIGAVDCSSEINKLLCESQEISKYPQINIYRPVAAEKDEKGFIKKQRTEYTGEKKAKYIAEYGLASIPSLVAPLTNGNTETNAQINYNTFLGVATFPKLVLVSNKPETPLLFRALSLEFLGRVIFGEIKEKETELIELLNIKTYPTVIFFQPGSSTPIVYEGEKNHDGIVDFINKTAIRPGQKKEEPKEKREPVYNPEPEEIKTQEELLRCINGYGVCAISVLAYEPDFEESVKQHEEELAILRNLKENNRKIGGPFKFTWINSIEHGKKFIRDFDVPDMLPVFMIVNGKKKLYRLDRGAFDEDSINTFLKDVRNGRGRFFSYNFDPKLDNIKDEL